MEALRPLSDVRSWLDLVTALSNRNYSRVLSLEAQNVVALSKRPQDEVAIMSSRFSTIW
jgi:hypothetical protein